MLKQVKTKMKPKVVFKNKPPESKKIPEVVVPKRVRLRKVATPLVWAYHSPRAQTTVCEGKPYFRSVCPKKQEKDELDQLVVKPNKEPSKLCYIVCRGTGPSIAHRLPGEFHSLKILDDAVRKDVKNQKQILAS